MQQRVTASPAVRLLQQLEHVTTVHCV
eukprot:COSAG01_NODE_35845_length_525_cov_19.842723_1_plen_26_part_10